MINVLIIGGAGLPGHPRYTRQCTLRRTGHMIGVQCGGRRGGEGWSTLSLAISSRSVRSADRAEEQQFTKKACCRSGRGGKCSYLWGNARGLLGLYYCALPEVNLFFICLQTERQDGGGGRNEVCQVSSLFLQLDILGESPLTFLSPPPPGWGKQ